MPEPTPPPNTTESLAKLVSQKRRLLEQLSAIGRRQGELIDAGDVATLLRLLVAKQQLIAALRVVERGLDPFRGDDPESRVWASPAGRAACAADAEACRTLLAAVLQMEREHEQRIEDRRDGLADQLQRAHGAHAAASAYQPHRRAARPLAPTADTAAPIAAPLDLSSGG